MTSSPTDNRAVRMGGDIRYEPEPLDGMWAESLNALAAHSPAGREILATCLGLARFLIRKNTAYGDSALKPIRVFGRGLDEEAQILVRMDDKLSRIAKGDAAGEDAYIDLAGYIVLLDVARRRKRKEIPPVTGFIRVSPAMEADARAAIELMKAGKAASRNELEAFVELSREGRFRDLEGASDLFGEAMQRLSLLASKAGA